MTFSYATFGKLLLLAGTGLALAGCAATYSEPYYEPGYYRVAPAPAYYGPPPAYYGPPPGYYAVPRAPQNTFVFSYTERERSGRRHDRRRHWD